MEEKDNQNLLQQMSKILIPPEYLESFEVTSIEEQPSEWLIELREKAERIPKAIAGKEVIMDGYCNPIDIMTHAFSLKRIYLRMYRRRWREQGSQKHIFNTYDLHIAGMKTTKAFGAFLKEFDR